MSPAVPVAEVVRLSEVDKHWYDPVELYREGYPEDLTSAMKLVPRLRTAAREEVAALAPGLVLEIGPGDAPVLEENVVYLDVSPMFLANLSGPRVRADLFTAPFEPGTFDVVIAADVLTHIRPGRRIAALEATMALGRHVILFNPELGSDVVSHSRVPTQPLVEKLADYGFRVKIREFLAAPAHRMHLLTATR